MNKEKLKLSELKVQSFITSLEGEQLEEVKGGLKSLSINGKKTNYKIRWTSLDTRLDSGEKVAGAQGQNG